MTPMMQIGLGVVAVIVLMELMKVKCGKRVEGAHCGGNTNKQGM